MASKTEPVEAIYHLTRPAAVLRATGPDAFAFLQSQFSNDLRRPGVEQPVTYGLWLNHKGKIQADSFVLRLGPQEFLLVSYDSPADTLRTHLEAHLIADEVELRDETPAFSLVQVSLLEQHGGAAARFLLAEAPAKGTWVKLRDQPELIRWLGRRPSAPSSPSGNRKPSWDFLGPAAAVERFAAGLTGQGIQAESAELFQFLRITESIPTVPFDAGPGDLPQECGLERDAVSFDKGCYLGQEVMARLQTQGHVNRALWHVMVLGRMILDVPKDKPLPLFAGDKSAGELRCYNGIIGLAMLKKNAIAGREGLSLTPGGDEVVRLAPAEFVGDLTAPKT
jgi:tRNA-modifying protein YgfZ